MGTVIYVNGEAELNNLTTKQEEKILQMQLFNEPIFVINNDTLEFAFWETESCTPLEDYIVKPLEKVIKIVNGEIEGVFFIESPDCRDYDNIALFIEDGKLVYRNSVLVNATDEELEAELRRRKE